MRRIVCTATLSIFLFLAGVATTTASSRDNLFDTVNATMDSSGVSIIINHSSASLDSDTSGNISITVSSSSTEQTLVCTLDPGKASIDVRRQGEIDVNWTLEDGGHINIETPSIQVAGILSNFTCESAGD
jgi:hypothetical protein